MLYDIRSWREVSLKRSITVGSLVMHHQLTIHEVKTVRYSLKRTHYHLLLQLRAEIRQVVHRLHRILRVRHAERHLELKRFYQLSFEVMLLNHHEFADWLSPYSKFQSCPHSSQFKKLRPEVILNEAGGVGRFFANFRFWLSYFEEDLIGLGISDPKAGELYVIGVVLRRAEVLFGGLLQCPYLLQSDAFAHYNNYSNVHSIQYLTQLINKKQQTFALNLNFLFMNQLHAWVFQMTYLKVITSKSNCSPPFQQPLHLQVLLPQCLQLYVLRLQKVLHAPTDVPDPTLDLSLFVLQVLPQLVYLLQQSLFASHCVITLSLLLGLQSVVVVLQFRQFLFQFGQIPCQGSTLHFLLVQQRSSQLQVTTKLIHLPLHLRMRVLQFFLLNFNLLGLSEQLSPLPFQQTMFLNNGFIFALNLMFDGLVINSFSLTLYDQNLIFKLVVIKCQSFLSLSELVQFFTILVGSLLKQSHLSGKLPFSPQALRQLLLHFIDLSLQPGPFILMIVKHLRVLVMLLFYLLQVSHQDRVLPHQKPIFLLQLTQFLSLISRYGLNNLINILVLSLYNQFQLVVLSQNLLANTNSVRKLPFQYSQFLAQQTVLFLQRIQNRSQLAIERQNSIN